MKISQDHKLQLSNSILLIGEPGTGKTILATQFPKPFILNVDNNLDGPLRWLRANGHSKSFCFGDVMFVDCPEELEVIGCKDKLEPNSSGKIAVPRKWRYKLAAYLLQQAIDSPEVETIVIDSFSSFNEVIKDEVRVQYDLPISEVVGKKITLTVDKRPDKQSFALWDGYLSLTRNLIFQLKATGKRLVCIAHVVNKESNDSMSEFICIPGQFGEQIPSFFEEVWKLELVQELKGGKLVQNRFVRTRPKPNQTPLGLKSAAQLQSLESIESFENFFKKLT